MLTAPFIWVCVIPEERSEKIAHHSRSTIITVDKEMHQFVSMSDTDVFISELAKLASTLGYEPFGERISCEDCIVVCGAWCVVCGMWYVVCGVWCVVCGIWCALCGMWYVVCGVWYVVCLVWCVVCSVWYVVNYIIHRLSFMQRCK